MEIDRGKVKEMRKSGKRLICMIMVMQLMLTNQVVYANTQELDVDYQKKMEATVSDNDLILRVNSLESPDIGDANKELLPEVEIDEINFPDSIFREYVVTYFDQDDNGYLTVSEIEQVTYIDVSWSGIISLEGINYFFNLEYLYCNNNELRTLDVSRCANLVKLYCYDNELDSLDVSGCTSLGLLYCDNNQLSTLDISYCTKLVYLHCNSNQLKTLDVSHCANLITLFCFSNQLKELDVSKCVNLVTLFCSSNQLSILDVSYCMELVYLHCNSNKLRTLDISQCANLKILFCYSNQLTELDVSECVSLVDLLCEFNQLKELDVSECENLEFLSCYANQLKKLDVNQCSKLTELLCFDNQLKELDLSQCTSLTELSCYTNLLKELDVIQCSKLTELSCYSNQLKELDLSQCVSLEFLGCAFNLLKELDVSQCVNITYLHCSDNQLKELDVSRCVNLKRLYCYRNQLYALDVSKNTLLIDLICTDNIYHATTKEIDITTLARFDIIKVVDEKFTNGILAENVLSFVNNEQTVTYQYDTGWGAPITFGIQFLSSIQIPVEEIFFDISKSNWYYNAVQFVYDNGIMSGKSNRNFDPAGNLTRAEFATTLYGMEGRPEISYVDTFSDVPIEQWYTNPVLWASRNNITSGYGNSKFGVSDNITREQLAMMMYKYAIEMCGYEERIEGGVLEKYSDSTKVSSWAVIAMEWAVTNGIISGTGDNRLNPQGNALRCECAQILKSFYDKFRE